MGIRAVRKAVFLDRDGIITALAWNPRTQAFESPHSLADLKFVEENIPSLQALSRSDFYLFTVSNQPSYAKGKTSLESLLEIHEQTQAFLVQKGIIFQDYFYCHHHPGGVVPAYSGNCLCRKPNAYFIMDTCRRFGFSPSDCWMIGDQDTDVLCGQRAGVKTGLVEYPFSENKRGQSRPDVRGKRLEDVVNRILNS